MLVVMDCRDLNIYTDGSSKKWKGGIGVKFIFPEDLQIPDKEFHLPGYNHANAPQMELKASIEALKRVIQLGEVKEGLIPRIVIHTDCQYLVDGFPSAVCKWSKNGWLKSGGGPVSNTELWKDLLKIARKIPVRIEFNKVQGHSDDIFNQDVDRLAKESGKKAVNILDKSVVVRKKISPLKTVRGSVLMLGQKIKIRVITSKYLKHHKLFEIRYEVISKRSPYYQNVDIIHSPDSLRPNHSFEVILGNNKDFPKIERVLKEIDDGHKKKE